MLSVGKLIKVYPGGVTALRGIDLQVDNGMFGLLGPNGAGKSTFMKILAGLLEPTSGEVTLDGHDVLADPHGMQQRLGYLPQDFGFYPHLTGEAMLTYLLRLKGVEASNLQGGLKGLVSELLSRVNLAHAAKRKVKGYSGGMRQRLGIAQALAGNPRMIIVDEPTAGLDPEERQRFYRLLAELAEDRIVLLSTHIVEDVGVLCPRFAVIRNGELVAVTSPTEALAGLEGTIYEGRGTADDLATVRGRFPITQALVVAGENRLRIQVPRADYNGSSATPPAGFRPVTATLEDAYMTLVASASAATPETPEAHHG